MFGISFCATVSLSEHQMFVQEEKPVAILGIGTVFHGCGCEVNRICALRDSTARSVSFVFKSETSPLPMDVLQRHLARTVTKVVPYIYVVKVKVKFKAILLQAWTGPEGFRRLRLPDFKTIGT
jgi:hypothetical protein